MENTISSKKLFTLLPPIFVFCFYYWRKNNFVSQLNKVPAYLANLISNVSGGKRVIGKNSITGCEIIHKINQVFFYSLSGLSHQSSLEAEEACYLF